MANRLFPFGILLFFNTVLMAAKNCDNSTLVLSQSNFSRGERVYVIEKNYTLQGEIELPEDCILDFRGGSIRNGIIRCNNNYLQGRVQLLNTTLCGTIENNQIESDWFGLKEGINRSVDNCEKISHLIASCENTRKDLHVGSGIYCTSQPVVFNVDYNVYMDGEFRYIGNPNASAIYIGSNEGRKGGKTFYLSVSQLEYPTFKEDENHLITTAPRNVGIEISSVFSCEFHIKKIEEFIYGLVIIDNRSLGCGDNEFHIGEIRNAYHGIRIIAGDTPEKETCWVNDNKFYGGRIWYYRNPQLKRTAIKFERANNKGMSDNALFLAMDLENNYAAIDFGGFATGCISLGCRFENNEDPFINEGNRGNLIIGGQKYVKKESKGPRTYFDYASELWRLKLNNVILDIPQIKYAYDGRNITTKNLRLSNGSNYQEVGELALPSGVRDDGGLNINNTRLFVDIDVSKVRMVRIESLGLWRAMMDFYDADGRKIKPFEQFRDHLFFYDANVDGWYNKEGVFSIAYKMETGKPLELFLKDPDIKKIRLYIWGDATFGDCWINSLKITTDAYASVDNVNKLFHLSSIPIKTNGVEVVPRKAETGIVPGTVYFDKGNKPIFWNGNEWVDAMGNIAK